MNCLFLEQIDENAREVCPDWWRQLASLILRPGLPFEIRCWREESAARQKAAALGTLCEAQSTDYEASYTGTLSPAVIRQLLQEPLPDGPGEMSPFFTIRVGDIFCSSHYGKEICLNMPTEELCRQIQALLDPIRAYFLFTPLNLPGDP